MLRTCPRLQEAAIFDKFLEIIKARGKFDVVVFDTAPTGHILLVFAQAFRAMDQ